MDPTDAVFHHAVATSLAAAGKDAEAMVAFEEALALSYRRGWVHDLDNTRRRVGLPPLPPGMSFARSAPPQPRSPAAFVRHGLYDSEAVTDVQPAAPINPPEQSKLDAAVHTVAASTVAVAMRFAKELAASSPI